MANNERENRRENVDDVAEALAMPAYVTNQRAAWEAYEAAISAAARARAMFRAMPSAETLEAANAAINARDRAKAAYDAVKAITDDGDARN